MSKYVSLHYVNAIGIKELVYVNVDGKKIYKLNNGYKFKEFPENFRSMQDPDVKYMHDYLLAQSQIDLKTVVVPEMLVVDDNNLYGYLAPFVEGVEIKNIDPEFLITELLRIIQDIESDIRTLSREGWVMEDLHDQNLLISQELSTGHIIDTDCYIKTKKDEYRRNMACVFDVIVYSILPRIQLSRAFKNKLIERYFYMGTVGLLSTNEFLRTLLIQLKQLIITNVTVQDLRLKLQ